MTPTFFSFKPHLVVFCGYPLGYPDRITAWSGARGRQDGTIGTVGGKSQTFDIF
jgi:hypothetical protein